MTINPEELARAELAAAMVPTPDDIMADLTPMAGLFYLDQMAWGVLKLWAAEVSDLVVADSDASDDLGSTMATLADIVGQVDGLAAKLGLIPAEQVPPAPVAG